MPNVIKESRLIFAENGIDPKTGKQINSYKWWNGQLLDNDMVHAEWGRVGDVQGSGEWPGGQRYLDKKVKEKLRKGYTEQKTVGSVTNGGMAPTVVKNQDLHTIARAQLIKSSNPTLERLISRFVQANVHKITTSTQITYNANTGGFTTPLGQVTMEGLLEARDRLAELAPLVRNRRFGPQADKILCLYLRIIPQDIGRRGFSTETLIPDENALQRQSDLVDSLESSLQAATPAAVPSQPTKPMEQVFKVDLEVLTDMAERARLDRFFERTKKSMHNYDRIHVKEIFKVNIHDMTRNFESNMTPVEEVFHGTSQANCLSILKSGLKVAPPSTAAIAGKLFGNGIYGANCSTKSLGYSMDRWGQGGVGDAGWLYICDFAMGRIFHPSTADSSGPPHGYDSTFAKGGRVTYNGRTLYNDELIVYKNSQCKIKYLLECK